MTREYLILTCISVTVAAALVSMAGSPAALDGMVDSQEALVGMAGMTLVVAEGRAGVADEVV